jgi:hypothetical protein
MRSCPYAGLVVASSVNSPTQVALAAWPLEAEARVVAETVVGDRAEVVLQVGPDYEYWVYCKRDGQGYWHEVGSSNAPSVPGWSDPSVTEWE